MLTERAIKQLSIETVSITTYDKTPTAIRTLAETAQLGHFVRLMRATRLITASHRKPQSVQHQETAINSPRSPRQQLHARIIEQLKLIELSNGIVS